MYQYLYFHMASLHLSLVVCGFVKCPRKLAKSINAIVGVSTRIEFNMLVKRVYIIIHTWSAVEDTAML